jgi:protein-tyrosine phosphatase
MNGDEPMPDWDYWYLAYHAMLDNSAPMFVNTLSLLAEPDRLPAMYHCTGGKDRTGLASVLLLDMLGVPAETLLDDFELTNLHRTPVRVREMGPGLAAKGVSIVDALPMLGVVRAAMHDAYMRLVTEHGGAERYLVERGLDPSVPGRLRDLLLVPA